MTAPAAPDGGADRERTRRLAAPGRTAPDAADAGATGTDADATERTRRLTAPRPGPAAPTAPPTAPTAPTAPSAPTAPLPPAAAATDTYSATALDSGWGTGPRPAGAAVPGGSGPDAAEAVLRYGPGVPPTAATLAWTGAVPGTAAGAAPPDDGRSPAASRRRFRRLRRYGAAVTVLTAVAAFLLWERAGPPLEITGVAVTAEAPAGCDATAPVTAVLRTNGRPGTIRYRWHRSDGTVSAPLEERVGRGRREARLTLLWTFQGRGTVEAVAELRVTAPASHTASAAFTYRCP